MDEVDLERLRDDLQSVPVPAMITELPTSRFVMVNDAAAALFGAPAEELEGATALSHIHPLERRAAQQAYKDLAANVINAYQVRRRVIRPDGTELSVTVWGRRVEAQGRLFGLWVLARDEDAAALDTMSRAEDLILAVTDHDWLVAYVSAGARLVRGDGTDLIGTPLLGLVHPSVAAEFLAAASRAVKARMAVTVLTRLRSGRNEWTDRYCVIVPMCEHDPPRLGVVVTLVVLTGRGNISGLELKPNVEHCAVEARAGRALQAVQSLARQPSPPNLSARQLEMLSGVIAGESVEQLARSHYLSPSTVRNHLSQIYRRFGVHSRAELLATVLRATAAESDEFGTVLSSSPLHQLGHDRPRRGVASKPKDARTDALGSPAEPHERVPPPPTGA